MYDLIPYCLSGSNLSSTIIDLRHENLHSYSKKGLVTNFLWRTWKRREFKLIYSTVVFWDSLILLRLSVKRHREVLLLSFKEGGKQKTEVKEFE